MSPKMLHKDYRTQSPLLINLLSWMLISDIQIALHACNILHNKLFIIQI